MPSLLDEAVGSGAPAIAALPLLLALHNGHVQVAALFAERLGEFLLSAVKRADLPTVRLLLQPCALERTSEDHTLLRDACLAAVDAPAPDGSTPLQWAAALPPSADTEPAEIEIAREITRALLARGADAARLGRDGLSSVHWATLLCHAEQLEALLEGEGRAAEALGRRAGPAADDLMRVHDGRRRPQGASRLSALEMFRRYGSRGCESAQAHAAYVRVFDVWADGGGGGEDNEEPVASPIQVLVQAAAAGTVPPATLEHLLMAYPLLVARLGKTLRAATATAPAVLPRLLELGIDPDTADQLGVTALMSAASMADTGASHRTALLLLSAGASLNLTAHSGAGATRCALDFAVRSWRLERAAGQPVAASADRAKLVRLALAPSSSSSTVSGASGVGASGVSVAVWARRPFALTSPFTLTAPGAVAEGGGGGGGGAAAGRYVGRGWGRRDEGALSRGCRGGCRGGSRGGGRGRG